MTEDQALVSATNPAVSSSHAPADDPIEILNQLLQKATSALQLQNADGAKQTATIAKAVYEQYWTSLPPEALFIAGMFKNLICLLEPLTRALVLQMEGRFTEAIAGIEEAFKLNDQLMASINKYAESAGDGAEVLGEIEPVFRPFPILFRGVQAYIRADQVGYQGRVTEYLGLLRQAVEEFKRVDELPQSTNPVFLMLAGICATMASRLQTRALLFEFRSDVRAYPQPTGKKVFIIHGRAEGKWRELRDLLEDRYQQEVVVLEEEVDGGSTLIDKFITVANESCYAFALLTPDDFAKNGDTTVFQARPNVLFELGWFYGRFGPGRVSILKQRGTAIPSDLDGILSIDFTDKVSEGLIKIENELQRIGRLGGGAKKGKARKAVASRGPKQLS